MEVVVSTLAYVKSLLHAYKHTSCSVTGILIGQKSAKGHIEVEDAIALNHGVLMSPLLELAFMQVQLFCDKKGVEIVGIYHGNEGRSDTVLSPQTQAIADTVANANGQGLILLINNSKLGNAEFAFDTYTLQGKSWTQTDKVSKLSSMDALQSLSNVLSRDVSGSFSDYADHMDDMSKDWYVVH